MLRRPIPIVLVSGLYLISGVAGIVYHAGELSGPGGLSLNHVGVLLLRVLAIVAGIALLLRHSWARWLVLAWMGFHVIIGALDSMGLFFFHLIFLIILSILLFRPSVNRWLRRDDANEGK